MPRKNPILAVNKKRKYSRTSPKKKGVSCRSARGKKRVLRDTPRWVYILLYVLIILVFSSGFYYFFIRPYAYRWRPCSNEREYGVCMPAGYEIHGIDISHYQGIVDWEKLKQSQSPYYPIHFVFVKATEGGDLNDDAFKQNFEAARKHGFVRGAYHFYNPATSASKQADFFINTVHLDAGDLPPVLDVELTGKRKPDVLKREVKTWLDKVEKHYRVKPIIYASYKFKTRYLDDPIFDSYPYWIAHYYVDSVKYEGKWQFWQHTDVGSISGIDEDVDLNVFNGTLEDLQDMTIKK